MDRSSGESPLGYRSSVASHVVNGYRPLSALIEHQPDRCYMAHVEQYAVKRQYTQREPEGHKIGLVIRVGTGGIPS